MSIYDLPKWINATATKIPLYDEGVGKFTEKVLKGHTGFVFDDSHPYFFLDMDNCYDPVTGQFTTQAKEILDNFPNAAIEISQSGHGIHLVGKCNKSLLVNKRNRFLGFVEFYIRDRYMFHGRGFSGDFNIDWTKTLMEVIPDRDINHSVLTSQMRNTTPDDEVLKTALESQGGIATRFGGKATFRDLFYCDPVLAQYYPSSTHDDGIDHSSADAALMYRLAYHCRGDSEQMDRLFRRSHLFREKYEKRIDYRNSLMTSAIMNVRVNPELPIEVNIPVIEDSYMTVMDQREYFKDCIYIRKLHRVLTPLGEFLTPDRFKAAYGGYTFQMNMTTGMTTKNAFQALTENQYNIFPKVSDVMFDPKLKPFTVKDNLVNIYIPENTACHEGDPAPFLDLLQRMLPDARDRDILLSYMAAIVQYKGVKFQWTVVIQGAQGNGKSFISKCLMEAVGTRYYHKPNPSDLTNKFNDFLIGKLLIDVQEIHMHDRKDFIDNLKEWITDTRIEVQPKGGDKHMYDYNVANWIMATNHRDAILKDKNDRRFCIFFTNQQTAQDLKRDGMNGDYFPDLWNWARRGGFGIVHHYLKHYKINPEFNPAEGCHRAPDTSSTNVIINEVKSPVEQLILECVEEERYGFRKGWISSYCLNEVLHKEKFKLSPAKLGYILRNLGYHRIGRLDKNVIQEGNIKPCVWSTNPNMRISRYEQDQQV